NDASRSVMKETDVNRRLRSEPTTRLTHIKIERTWHSGIQSPEDTHTQPTQGFTIRLMWTKSIRNCLVTFSCRPMTIPMVVWLPTVKRPTTLGRAFAGHGLVRA